MTTIGEANGKSSTFTINSYPDRLCGLPVVESSLMTEKFRLEVYIPCAFLFLSARLKVQVYCTLFTETIT